MYFNNTSKEDWSSIIWRKCTRHFF